MTSISKSLLKKVRIKLAKAGQKAFKQKTTAEQRLNWRKLGGEATRIKFLKKRRLKLEKVLTKKQIKFVKTHMKRNV